jgi:cytochrome c553
MNPVPRSIAGSCALYLAAASLFVLSATADAAAAAGVGTEAAICGSCHGMRGEGALAGAPRLAGQNADYMAHALAMFKAGTRASPIMQPIAAGLTDAQMHELAVYFAGQKPPAASAAAAGSPALVPAGKQLATLGAAKVAACFSCHGANGAGSGARFPRIAGEPAQFVIDRLHQFQARARNAAPQPGSMSAVAAMMTESQIQAAAAYLSRSAGN